MSVIRFLIPIFAAFLNYGIIAQRTLDVRVG